MSADIGRAEELLTLTRDATEDESAEIKGFIRERGPLAEQLAIRWHLEAGEVYQEEEIEAAEGEATS